MTRTAQLHVVDLRNQPNVRSARPPVIRTVLAGSGPLRDRLDHELGELFRFEVVGRVEEMDAAIAVTARDQPDVLLLDGQLDDVLSGLPELVAASPETRVIVLTEGTGTAFRDQARASGATAVVGKSDSIDRLVGTIDKLLPGAASAGAPAVTTPASAPTPDASLLEVRPLRVERTRWFEDHSVRPWLIAGAIAALPAGAAIAYVVATLAGLLR